MCWCIFHSHWNFLRNEKNSPMHSALAGPFVWNVRKWENRSGCIGSSGNVRVYVWIRYRSLVMEYGEPCIPERMDDLHKKALQLPYVKLLCDESHGYPNWGFGFGFGFWCIFHSHWNFLRNEKNSPIHWNIHTEMSKILMKLHI
jgi:hypothetical protein